MLRYERVAECLRSMSGGPKSDRFGRFAGYIRRDLTDEEVPPNIHVYFSCRIDAAYMATCVAHYEAGHPFGDPRDVIRTGIATCIEYFWGRWRDGYNHFEERLSVAQCRSKLGWLDPYRKGLVLALLADAKELKQIVTWPGDDLPPDDGVVDLPPADKTYHIVLAAHLRGDFGDAEQQQLDKLCKSKVSHTPRMARTLAAIRAGDADLFAQEFTDYLRWYRKHEFHLDWSFHTVCLEGTILWHVARRAKLKLPELPVELADMIVTKETVGIK